MPKVDLQRPLSVPAVPAREALRLIMGEIAEQKKGWSEFALYIAFSALGMPDIGYVAIPVRIEDIRENSEPRHEIRFKIHALRSPDAFPTFDGAAGIDSTGPSSSSMWLGGTYEPPMHGLGAMLDQFVARGTAERALKNMLEELAEAVEARVQARELERARYRTIFGAGD